MPSNISYKTRASRFKRAFSLPSISFSATTSRSVNSPSTISINSAMRRSTARATFISISSSETCQRTFFFIIFPARVEVKIYLKGSESFLGSRCVTSVISSNAILHGFYSLNK